MSSTPSAGTTSRILRDRSRRTARIIWLVAVGFGLLFFLASLPLYYGYFLDPTSRYTPYAPVLAQLGLGLEALATYMIAFDVLLLLLCLVVAFIIFWRRSDDWLAISTSLMLVYIPVGFSPAIAQLSPLLGGALSSVAFVLIIFPMSLFPDGTFKPPWVRTYAFLTLPFWLAIIPLQADVLSGRQEVSSIYSAVVTFGMFLILIGLVGQVQRYRRFADAVQRQQSKFVVFGAAAVYIVDLLVWLPASIPELAHPFAAPDRAVYTLPSLITLLIAKPTDFVSFAIFPIAFGLAITRQRLWDIDLVINRSLVLGLVTGLIALIFLGFSFLVQTLVGSDQPTLVLGLSVLSAAFLFNPARRQAQRVVDRRLYGFRFDLNQLAHAQKPEIRNAGALTGRIFNRYELLGMLGKGGMGEVYKAYADERVYALKILPETLVEDDSARRRFMLEAEAIGALEHPHIVSVRDHGMQGDLLYIVMDFIDGIDLGEHLKANGAMTLEEALPILEDVTSALDYVHERGLVHRDIKPSNVMLRPKAGDSELVEAVLLDFGVAKIESSSTRLTGTGAIGTIDYMAPEQIRESRAVDQRADIYALGVMTFEMLAGRRPFTGSAAQVMFAHIQQPAPSLSEFVPEIAPHISLALLRAMEKEAEQRFTSAGEFYQALRGH